MQPSTFTHKQSIADPSGDRSVKAQLSSSWTNVARPCFLLEIKLATVKCGINNWSALVQGVSCGRITRDLYLVDNWVTNQIFLALRPSIFRCNIMGTSSPNLPSEDSPDFLGFAFASGAEGLSFCHLGSASNSSSLAWSCASFQDSPCDMISDDTFPKKDRLRSKQAQKGQFRSRLNFVSDCS